MTRLTSSLGSAVGVIVASAFLAFLPVAAEAGGDGLSPPQLGAAMDLPAAAQQAQIVWIPAVVFVSPQPGYGYAPASAFPWPSAPMAAMPIGASPYAAPIFGVANPGRPNGGFFGSGFYTLGPLPTGPGPVIIPGAGTFGFPYATEPGPVIFPGGR